MVCDKERQRRFARFLKGKPRFIIKGELYFRLKPSLHFIKSDLLKARAAHPSLHGLACARTASHAHRCAALLHR
jgi:hypothetical protein